MNATEALRALWTIGTGIGTLVMLVLLREVMLDAWAIEQVRRPGLDVLRMITIGEVTDQRIRVIALASLFAAGLLSYVNVFGAMSGLLTGWIAPSTTGLLCLSAALQIWLGIVRLRRRRKLFDQLRIRPAREQEEHA